MMRDITIHAVLNGFVVQVGCQTVVFSQIEQLLHTLGQYLRNPEETEKDFTERAINARWTLNGALATPTSNETVGGGAYDPTARDVPSTAANYPVSDPRFAGASARDRW